MQIEILADCALLGKGGSGGKSVRHDRVCRSVHPVMLNCIPSRRTQRLHVRGARAYVHARCIAAFRRCCQGATAFTSKDGLFFIKDVRRAPPASWFLGNEFRSICDHSFLMK
jgi:hypothetical protein